MEMDTKAKQKSQSLTKQPKTACVTQSQKKGFLIIWSEKI